MRAALLVIFMFVSGYAFADDQTAQCLKGLKKDRRFSSITNHVVVDGSDATNPRMLNDKTRPDEQQKRAIADWIDARSQCVNLGPVKISVDLHLLFLSIVPGLYNTELSYGEFNRKWHTLYTKAMEAPLSPPDQSNAHHHH